MTKTTALYGCHNRKPFRTSTPVQDGWFMDGVTRVAKMISVPFRMSPNCQYTHTELGKVDPKCNGCKWKAT